jgi:hypothetical protein
MQSADSKIGTWHQPIVSSDTIGRSNRYRKIDQSDLSPISGCIQASLSLNCLKLTIPGCPCNCLPVSCSDIDFLTKILGLVLAWKSGLKVPLLPLGRSCPMKTILLSDLVRCDSPLQIIMSIWRTIIDRRGLSHPTQKIQIQAKSVPNCHYYICRGLSHPAGRATLLSDNI